MPSNASATENIDPDRVRTIEPSITSALPHYLPLLVFPLIIASAYFGGWWLAAPFIFFSLAMPLDQVLGLDGRRMDPAKTPERTLLWHNLPVWAWAFLWPPTLIFGLWQILVADALVFWQDILLAIILTMEGQAVFVVAHELVHRRSIWQRRTGEFLLASASYPQYATEHVYVHHAQVGTPHDAGSAPKGMSFWKYFPKEIASNLVNAWQVARSHLARKHLPVWHYTNPFWRYALAMAFWHGLVFWMGGIWAVLVFAFLGLSCVFSMKISNYFQHYGLRRVRTPNGHWEKVMPRHSWNADWKFSNWMFFNMQRHADHHARALRQYPLLQTHGAEDSPQIPGTYGDMMNLVLRPKLWFAKMDPLVDQWRSRFYPEIDDWSAYDSRVTAARPDAIDAIVEIFTAAPRLARWIERSPEQLDTLNEREFTDIDLPAGFGPDPASETIARRGLARLYWTRELDIDEMRAQIAEIPAVDAKETADIARVWSNGKAFQVGMHLVRGNLSAREARIALSNLAEASVTAVLAAVDADYIERRGSLQGGGFAVGFLGDLASREVYPGLSMQLLFIHDGVQAGDHRRLSQAFRQGLSALASESLLFSPLGREQDTSIRLPLSDLARHCACIAPADYPDLSRARIAFETGDADIAARFETIRRQVLAEGATSETMREPAQEESQEENEMRVSCYQAMPGGLEDIEHAARFVQTTGGGAASRHSAASAADLLRGHGSLADAAGLWRDLQCILRLVGDSDFDVDQAGTKVKSLIARACGHEDFDQLSGAVTDTASRAQRDLKSLFASA